MIIPVSFIPKAKQETRARVQWDHSLSEPMELKSDAGLYYHVDFNGVQPCLFLLSEFEDHRLRVCIPNILEKLRNEFVSLLGGKISRQTRGAVLTFWHLASTP